MNDNEHELEREFKDLIKLVRLIGYGEVTIVIRDGKPHHFEKAIKSGIFGDPKTPDQMEMIDVL